MAWRVARLYYRLDDFPTMQEMLGLPDRESSPEKVDDDDNNGLRRLFWIPPDVESPSSGLKPSSSAPKASVPRLRACVLCLRPRACVLCVRPRACVPYPRPRASVPCLQSLRSLLPEPRRSKRILSIPG
jgi:hypothetical protein